jgi:uncharacterized membrane-anchored protein YjiN (DUF445 family)
VTATLLTPAEAGKRRDLRRMKSVAAALLVVAAVVYVIARRAEDAGAPPWVGFVRAAAEAGMVGGLADWFAVTALFRRPLGLPIPHTALIPTRKDALGDNLGDFVGTHFLAEDVVRSRLRQVGLGGRIGGWLARPENADRVTAEAATAARAALAVLSDEDVQDLLERVVVRRLRALPAGPPAGQLLDGIVADGAHHGLVDALADSVVQWLRAHRDDVERLVRRQAPSWSPRLVDDVVSARVFSEVLRFATAVRDEPSHPLRASLDAWLAAFAQDLREDPATMARADALVERLAEHPQARQSLRSLGSTVRRLVLEAVENPASPLRAKVREMVADLGTRLTADDALQGKVDRWAEDALAYVVVNYRDELTTTITETVRRWDGQEAARRIELQVGRDLQFVRVNGTVVGALVGVVLHGIGVAL